MRYALLGVTVAFALGVLAPGYARAAPSYTFITIDDPNALGNTQAFGI